MSLLNQASVFSEGFSNKSGKRVPRMENTLKNMQQQRESFQNRESYQEPVGSNSMSLEIEENNKKAEKIQNIIDKMSIKTPMPQEDGSYLQDYIPPDLQQNKPKMNLYENVPEMKTTTENISVKREGFMNPASIHKQRGSSYSDSYSPTPYYKGLGSISSSNVIGVPGI